MYISTTQHDKLKKRAKKEAKLTGLPHAQLLEQYAREAGFKNYKALLEQVRPGPQPTYPVFNAWRDKVSALDDLSDWREQLAIAKEGPLQICYAPFDYINPAARVVIIGITPGETQAINALEALRTGMNESLDEAALLQKAKQTASFSGSMRNNLVAMLDAIGLAGNLDIQSCGELFEPDSTLAHFTSVLRYPVFINGENYNGNPSPLKTSLLREQVTKYFGKELQLLANAWLLPLGKVPEAVVAWFVEQGVVNQEHVLNGLPHPSPANAERIAYFLGQKKRDMLSAKTDPVKLDMARSRLISKLDGTNASCDSDKVMKTTTFKGKDMKEKEYDAAYYAAEPTAKNIHKLLKDYGFGFHDKCDPTNTKIHGYSHSSGKATLAHEHNNKQQHLWVPKSRVTWEYLMGDVKYKEYPSKSLWQNGKYGRHSGLRTYTELANADLVRFTPATNHQANDLLKALT